MAPSRAQTMDAAYELHPGNLQYGGPILEENANVYAEPSSDMLMSDHFLQGAGYSAESPGSTHGAPYFSDPEGIQVHNQAHGHFVAGGGGDLTASLGIGGMHNVPMPPGVTAEGIFGYGQLGQYLAANDGRLRGGESFPNHPAALFPNTQSGPGEGGDSWYAGAGFGFAVSGQPNHPQHQPTYWGA